MKKIVISIVFVFALMSVCLAATFTFKDMDSSHWAYEDICKMVDQGLLKGYEDGSFKPEKEVTREEFAQMVYNVVKIEATTEQLQNYYDVRLAFLDGSTKAPS